MKRVIWLLLLVGNFLFANDYLESIYENIIIKNSELLIKDAQNMKQVVMNKDKDNLQSSFTNLIMSWKRVEAFYLLGELNMDYIDTPRYVDFFHYGNEDLEAQIETIVLCKEEVEVALFKNSFRSINALEYIVSKYDINNERVNQVAQVILDKLISYFLDIKSGYKESKNSFIENEQKANAMMLNTLIETSYKLKEWRIGDVVGMSRKYKKDSDIKRSEYFASKNSLNAIKAILEVNNKLFSKQNFKNYGDLLRSYGVDEELESTLEYINNTIEVANNMTEKDLESNKRLFLMANRLYINYYITLIEKLKIKAKVLDADGD